MKMWVIMAEMQKCEREERERQLVKERERVRERKREREREKPFSGKIKRCKASLTLCMGWKYFKCSYIYSPTEDAIMPRNGKKSDAVEVQKKWIIQRHEHWGWKRLSFWQGFFYPLMKMMAVSCNVKCTSQQTVSVLTYLLIQHHVKYFLVIKGLEDVERNIQLLFFFSY